jgi:hypothetical protein
MAIARLLKIGETGRAVLIPFGGQSMVISRLMRAWRKAAAVRRRAS